MIVKVIVEFIKYYKDVCFGFGLFGVPFISFGHIYIDISPFNIGQSFSSSPHILHNTMIIKCGYSRAL